MGGSLGTVVPPLLSGQGMTEAGQGADSQSSLASIMSTGRGWRLGPQHVLPRRKWSCGFGHGLRAGEARGDTGADNRWGRVGDAAAGAIRGEPLGPEGRLSGGTKGNPMERGEGDGCAPSRGARLATRSSQVGGGEGRAGF